MDWYTAVVHLVTAADGASAAFSKAGITKPNPDPALTLALILILTPIFTHTLSLTHP